MKENGEVVSTVCGYNIRHQFIKFISVVEAHDYAFKQATNMVSQNDACLSISLPFCQIFDMRGYEPQ